MEKITMKNHPYKIGNTTFAEAHFIRQNHIYEKAVTWTSKYDLEHDLVDFLVDVDCQENLERYERTGESAEPKKLTFYKAGDGKLFKTAEECRKHEEEYDQSVDWIEYYVKFLREKHPYSRDHSDEEYELLIEEYLGSIPEKTRNQF